MSNNGSGFKEYLFVDGYNIINSWEKLRSLSEIDLEVARNELIDIMTEYQYYTKIKVIIVFDAHMVKGNSGKKETIKGVEVVYTKEDETADHYIEKVLDDIGRVKKVRVATSDWMEQQVVLGRGGTRISARELEVEINNYKSFINKKNKRENQKNNLIIGRLDDEILKKLEKWGKNEK
ncbi:NYN domain-containing protein [Anaerosalibacter massiliensis]|uniref:NYN domain-containing protein n=1 Tax=Anaerosalibacter massiliensis TaxID=1347392 RepID=A0A9X2S880_9FIRM|nr:NYN domain-containing protein [Anaerosalibacter massiliensis]MCR2045557.1 NYN domain-containing protein [Anaerosalibacter massiliensis]